ncbi:MAG: RNA-binding cell elongation regulator Jag/EloR [Fimbriimonadaceae bacterium]|nr:RNA-binding cell elongation regulator Jag/EloR [Fimbriimonadaceae bacterium]
MSAIELTARSLEEGQKAAAEKLGVEVDRVSVRVLEETKGLFGKVNLRISAEVIPAATPAPEVTKPARGRKAAEPKPEAEEAPVEVAAETEAKDAAPRTGRGRRRPEKAAEPKPEDDGTPGDAATSDANGDADAEEVSATEADAATLLAQVEELLAKSGLKITATVASIQGRYVNLALDGKDASYLVGKHGEVLNSLQYLVNIIISRKLENGVRATVECNDYRRRREEVLTKRAIEIANQVVERGEEAVLDALPAFERRIVHKAIQDIAGVATYSEGEEPNRRVVIAPAE